MNILTCIETYIENDKSHYGCFVIEPLEAGQGITLGNALRRTLLSDLTGFSIVGVRINNLKHEFASIPGLREDILEILLNLKEIIFKTSFSYNQNIFLPSLKGFLQVKGPRILTASMFQLPRNILKIVNPNQYIGTLVDTSELYIEIDIENGKGYKLSEEKQWKREEDFILRNSKKGSTLFIDALFMPIRRVNYKTKLIHDTKGNIKESLILEIWTNGSLTPKRSLQEALKILINLFYPLFLTPNFLSLSSKLSN
uniref:RNA polymerase alpha subunit n=1 Tax=Mallomonas splendens TaxID=52552 RepID=A0A3G2R026_9STRA|nr:RNA polymerase alpha subunit [Mallomonas splendens]AYO28562.1 RNA polymerase alpha subunit [Mallomonas splendens]